MSSNREDTEVTEVDGYHDGEDIEAPGSDQVLVKGAVSADPTADVDEPAVGGASADPAAVDEPVAGTSGRAEASSLIKDSFRMSRSTQAESGLPPLFNSAQTAAAIL